MHRFAILERHKFPDLSEKLKYTVYFLWIHKNKMNKYDKNKKLRTQDRYTRGLIKFECNKIEWHLFSQNFLPLKCKILLHRISLSNRDNLKRWGFYNSLDIYEKMIYIW